MRLLVIGGSDAGIAVALRARELDPGGDVTVLVADAYPNYRFAGFRTCSPATSPTRNSSLTAPVTSSRRRG